MREEKYRQKALNYLNLLCSVKPNRRTGSRGNQDATDFFAGVIKQLGYTVDTTPFDCLDFTSGASLLMSSGESFDIFISPYSNACDVTAELVTVRSVEELEKCCCQDKILLLKDDICSEQLMPKNFVFYNPEHHQEIYALLEKKNPAGIITATRKNPELVGALDPFPVIYDGDFDIPNACCKDFIGAEIASRSGDIFTLKIDARRIPSTACNVIGRKNQVRKKIVITAHIDAYENSPGACDNAAGTVVLLLLAEMLSKYHGNLGVEIVAFNGEDHYSAAGQMDYLRRYGSDLNDVTLAINIDDAGYYQGKTAYSFYGCADRLQQQARQVFDRSEELLAGEPWYQGDHMIFAQQGIPAIAIASEKMREFMATAAHTSEDRPEIVDTAKLVEIAVVLKNLVMQL